MLSAKRQAIVDAARALVAWRNPRSGATGVRYRHEGRSLEGGLDCCGVEIWIGWQVVAAWAPHVATFDIRGYGREPQPGYVRHFIEAGCTYVPQAQWQPGDIAIMRFDSWPFHSGVIVDTEGHGRIVHAFLPRKRVVEEPFMHLLRNGIAGKGGWTHCLRFPGVED